jgi:hypothetical protein
MRQLLLSEVLRQTYEEVNAELKVVALLVSKQQMGELQSEMALSTKWMIIYDLTYLYNYYLTIPVVTTVHPNLPQSKAWNNH